MNFRFNQESFLLGLLAGWATAYAVYQARHVLGNVRRSFSQQAESAQEYASRSADSRYINDLVAFCRVNHMVGKNIPIDDVIIEPRFVAPQPFIEPPDEDVSYDVFRMIPKVHEMPYLYAPFNLNTLSIEELSFGEKTIALLGLPGSGRTTALQAIALWSLGEVDFTPPVDNVAARLEEEEAALTKDEREKRHKERKAIEDRARARLAEESGSEYDPEMERSGGKKGPSPYKKLVPMYVHIANIIPEISEFGTEVDPAEPLIRALQYQVGGITAKTLPVKMYERLNEGKALVMIDGLDDLPPAEQNRRMPWLRAFIEQYHENRIIVTGPASGYGALTRLGLVPVFLRPLNDLRAEKLIEKWADKWQIVHTGKQRRGDDGLPSEESIEILNADIRGLSFFDVCAKMRGYFAGDTDEESSINDWTGAYLQFLGLKEDDLPKLAQLGQMQLDEGLITVASLQAHALNQAGAKVPTPTTETEDADELRAEPESVGSVTVTDVIEKSDKELEESTGISRGEIGKLKKAESDFVAQMEKLGLLQKFKGDQYLFRHKLIASYVAAFTLQEVDDATIAEKGLSDAWYYAIGYATAHTPIDAAVKARMAQPPDLLYDTHLEVARWLAYATEKVAWKNDYLRELGERFITPTQYPLVRERVMSALVGTRDISIILILEQALDHPDPDIRRLGCLGVGALREERAVNYLAPRLQDQDEDVRLAAGVSLGAIGSEEAYEELVSALTSGTEQLRQAVSETFAAIPEEGYPLLYDAINSEDMMLRRAAVFGLRRVRATWALVEIYRRLLEDDQWYVRSAAQQAILDLQQNQASNTIKRYPSVEAIDWVREWVNSLGEAGAELTPDEALAEMLNDEEPLIKALSALAIGQLGMADKMPHLYMTLRDEIDVVRDSAHRALADLQLQIGRALPAPA